MFRSRFWLTLALSVPVVFFSQMFQDLLGYEAPVFPGSRWIPAVLGTAIFFYGGWPFLTGAVSEIRSRQPGMMLLIGLAITVAFAASWATEFGWVDLDFWWELAALISVMLLGHWLEMRAIGQASGALEALASLLPDEAELVTGNGVRTVPATELAVGDVVLVRSGGRVPADGVIVDGSAELDESMITGESRPRAPPATASSPARSRPTPRSASASRPWGSRPRSPASGGSSRRRSPRARGRRRWPIGRPRSCSTWRRRPASPPSSCGRPSATPVRRSSAPSRCSSSPARTRWGWRSRSSSPSRRRYRRGTASS
jgi:hypothetical protein